MKFVYIKTFGCQMNMYDSARMLDALTVLEEVYNFVKEKENENERNDSTGERDAD